MSKIVVCGGRKLSGEIKVDGSKNAALPILFATIATRGVTQIDDLPKIRDVSVALEILAILGAKIRREGKSVLIDTRALVNAKIPSSLTSALRASTYLIGACLSRFHETGVCEYGGCSFGSRPIDMHIAAAEALGAKYNDGYLSCVELTPGVIKFEKISVGATVNALIMCSCISGESRIYGFAREPHVMSLIDFLNGAGARIKVFCDHISVFGADLGGSYSRIIPDMIEAGTYLALSIATGSELTVVGDVSGDLSSFVLFLESYGVRSEKCEGAIRAFGRIERFAEVVTGPYPEFPTDLQPQTAPLLALCSGGRIIERVWSERFSYLNELSKFGICYNRSPGEAVILPSNVSSANAECTDLRGGAALLISALSASGESVIERSELIARGYTDVVTKLSRVGAQIKQID